MTLFMHYQNALPTDATSAQLASCKLVQVYPHDGSNPDPKLQALYPALGTDFSDAVERDAACRSGDGGGSSGSQMHSSSSSSSYYCRSVVGSDAMNWEDSWRGKQ